MKKQTKEIVWGKDKAETFNCFVKRQSRWEMIIKVIKAALI